MDSVQSVSWQWLEVCVWGGGAGGGGRRVVDCLNDWPWILDNTQCTRTITVPPPTKKTTKNALCLFWGTQVTKGEGGGGQIQHQYYLGTCLKCTLFRVGTQKFVNEPPGDSDAHWSEKQQVRDRQGYVFSEQGVSFSHCCTSSYERAQYTTGPLTVHTGAMNKFTWSSSEWHGSPHQSYETEKVPLCTQSLQLLCSVC